jgi:glutamine synthetase
VTSQLENVLDPLAFVGISDLAGHFRGKGFPVADLERRLRYGVGLTYSNIMLSAFGPIYATPFGTAGELMLLPDSNSLVRVQLDDDALPLHFYLGDIVTLEGKPWECCPRNFLRRALESLERETGLRIRASFEQEFVYTGVTERPGLSYSLDAFRRAAALGPTLLGAMRQAGLTPDSFLAEYAPSQYEVTAMPTIGMKAADEAVVMRELIRFVAEHLGHRGILAPVLFPDGVGNGTHIHLSLVDASGSPALHDPADLFALSDVGRSFVAGIAFHLPALAALTAPAVTSYYRLRPGKWAPTSANVVLQDRGAALRICSGYSTEPAIRAGQFNVEFRVADAAASPYMALGAVVHAGLDGIRRGMALPEENGDYQPLPANLSGALDLLERSGEVRGWLGAPLAEAYLMLKRAEIDAVAGLEPEEICRRYVDAYS